MSLIHTLASLGSALSCYRTFVRMYMRTNAPFPCFHWFPGIKRKLQVVLVDVWSDDKRNVVSPDATSVIGHTIFSFSTQKTWFLAPTLAWLRLQSRPQRSRTILDLNPQNGIPIYMVTCKSASCFHANSRSSRKWNFYRFFYVLVEHTDGLRWEMRSSFGLILIFVSWDTRRLQNTERSEREYARTARSRRGTSLNYGSSRRVVSFLTQTLCYYISELIYLRPNIVFFFHGCPKSWLLVL